MFPKQPKRREWIGLWTSKLCHPAANRCAGSWGIWAPPWSLHPYLTAPEPRPCSAQAFPSVRNLHPPLSSRLLVLSEEETGCK